MYNVNNVEDLYLFIFGYKYGVKYSEDDLSLNDLLNKYLVFMNHYFDIKSDDNRYSWDKLIRFYSGSDKHSLELFSQSFREFLEKEKLFLQD